MTRFFTYIAIVIGLGASATLAVNPRSVSPATEEARFAADGAFRDGLDLGKLAAAQGRPLRLAVGRWSADQDRSMFTAGYRRGYGESLASAMAKAGQSAQ